MKRVKNVSNKLIAVLLSAALAFTPMVQSVPVYAAEVVETESETEADNLGTMPKVDEGENVDSNNDSEEGNPEEAAGEEQEPTQTGDGDAANDDGASDDGLQKDDTETSSDTVKVEEKTEAETKPETEPKETVSDPVYEEVLEEESESGSEEESESESEEMSQEEVRATANVNDSDVTAGGWNESIYAEIKGLKTPDAVTKVSWSGTASGELDADGLKYLVRNIGNDTRIDIPGLKAGTYKLSITVNGTANPIEKSGITVYAYDRSGYAHFKYSDGVGAYKDDGTLKDNAIVIYVTDENKNTVELKHSKTGTTVNGIGNILNSVGKSCGEPGHENDCKKVDEGKVSYAQGNTNQDILKILADNNIPLVVRFVGIVSDSELYKPAQFNAASSSKINGLTAYGGGSATKGQLMDYGGTGKDNGHMARMKSGKNITLEGIGYDATIDGWGFHFMCESSSAQLGKSFEVRNLKFINTPEDAIGMEGVQSSGKITASVERCWIHNNEFYGPDISNPAESDKSEGDGSVDFKRGQYFTCSYNYFEGCHKTNLVGSSDSSLQYNLTFHHNHWYLCKARGPLGRQANMHMYNNIVEMQTDFAQNTRANAFIFSEYNMFYACKNPQRVDAGAIKSYHDTIASVEGATKATVVTNKSTPVSNTCSYDGTDYSQFEIEPTLSYIPTNDYKLDTNFTELRKVVTSQTGVQKREPKLHNQLTENDYSIMPKNATLETITGASYTKNDFKKSKIPWAFKYEGDFDIEIAYTGSVPGVLVNAAGENLLQGNGKVEGLPGGTYWIQAANIQAGDAKTLTPVSFKEITIESITITAVDPDAHRHQWELKASESIPASCTAEGTNVYECKADGECPNNNRKEETLPALGHDWISSGTNAKEPTCTAAGEGNFKCSRSGCNATNTGSVPALGHAWGPWVEVTPATTEAVGQEKHVCTRDDTHVETREIPKLGTTPSNPGLTVAGNYELYFTGRKVNGDKDFFNATIASYTDSKKSVTVNGTEYTIAAKFGASSINFSCNDGAILYLQYASESAGNKIKVDGAEKTIGSDGSLEITFSEGSHKIEKLSGDEVFLYYVSINNGESKETYHELTFHYNYGEETEEDEPEPKTIQVLEGETYNSMAALVPVSFTRSGYNLKGLYKDSACTQAVTYPYVANGNVTFYAKWEEDDTPIEESHTLFLDSNGGSSFVPVTVLKTDVYVITQKPTRAGYVFAGWYDAKDSGNLVSSIDGSKMTGDMTVYAHWKVIDDLQYLISFDAGTGKAPTGTESVVKAAGEKVALPDACTPATGYTFKGWSVDGTTVLTGEYTVNEEDAVANVITIVALYKSQKPDGIYIAGLDAPYLYTGTKIIPDIEVWYCYQGIETLLAQGVDYAVSYKNNVNPTDEAEVIVTGKGNYTGKDVTKKFVIKEAELPNGVTEENKNDKLIDLKGAKLDITKAVTYTGAPQYPDFTLTISGEEAKTYVYDTQNKVYKADDATISATVAVSNNINKGTATIFIKGKDGANGKPTTVKKTFKILPIDLSKSTVTVSASATKDDEPIKATYAVKGAVPKKIYVKVNYTPEGETQAQVFTLTYGKDYTVKYASNKQVNVSGSIVITGKGNFAKAYKDATFEVEKFSLAGSRVKALDVYEGMTVGKIKAKAATVTDGAGNALKPSQYEISVNASGTRENQTIALTETDMLEAGDVVTVTAAATDTTNLDGSTTAETFTVGRNIAKAKFELKDSEGNKVVKAYEGKEILLTDNDLTVTYKGKEGTDILRMFGAEGEGMGNYVIVSYADNINKGTATAVIKGVNGYSGTKTIKFKIVQKQMGLAEKSWEEMIKSFMNNLKK